MPTGTVKFFNRVKGFGFIALDDSSKDAFVHITAVERAGLSPVCVLRTRPPVLNPGVREIGHRLSVEESSDSTSASFPGAGQEDESEPPQSAPEKTYNRSAVRRTTRASPLRARQSRRPKTPRNRGNFSGSTWMRA